MPFIDANGVSLHYELSGARGSAVVCYLSSAARSIPGMRWRRGSPRSTACCAMTSAVAGLSEKVRQEFSNDTLVADFEALAKAVGFDAAVLFRHRGRSSDPGAAFPGKARRSGGFAGRCAIRRRASTRAARRASMSEPRSPCARACARRCRQRWRSPTRRRSASQPPTRPISAAISPTIPSVSVSPSAALARTNMLHMLPQIRCPTMVVAGRHDTVRPHAGTAELAKKIPGARFELIEEAGHFMPAQGPRAARSRCSRDFLPR